MALQSNDKKIWGSNESTFTIYSNLQASIARINRVITFVFGALAKSERRKKHT